MSSSSATTVLNRFTKHVQVALADYFDPSSKEEAKKIALHERVYGLPGMSMLVHMLRSEVN